MTGEFLICKLEKHQPIEGADNIVKVEQNGETIVTSKGTKEGTLGILFDCETQLDPEFCRLNDLYDDPLMNVTHGVKGYISAKNRRVRPITLRGVKVSGMFMPFSCVRYCFDSFAKYEAFANKSEGLILSTIGDVKICNKYVSPLTQRSSTGEHPNGKKSVKIKDRCPSFEKHFDTGHWGKQKIKFEYPYYATISEKLHGTSLRVGNLKVKNEKKWWQKLMFWTKYPESYNIVVGTRNTVKTYDLDNCKDDNLYVRAARYLLKYCTLEKDEVVFAEIVGFDGAKSIMPSQSNEKLKNYLSKDEYKEFIDQYGKTTTYDYWGLEGHFEVNVYRKTKSNVELDIETCWNHPPKINKYSIRIASDSDLEHLKQLVNENTNGKSLCGNHIKEGVCVRLEKDNDIQILKSKSYLFKVLEGIAKDSDTYQDIEEVN